MEYYSDLGVVEMRPWQFPMPPHQGRGLIVNGSHSLENPQHPLAFFKQQGALIDCVFRLMDDYKFLIIIDYDELIMPKQHPNIPLMMQYLE